MARIIESYRTREEILRTFKDDIDNRQYLGWHLMREKLALEETDNGVFSNWYQLICAALNAWRLKDYAELRRIVFQKMNDAVD